jgi:hypothetical protein
LDEAAWESAVGNLKRALGNKKIVISRGNSLEK